MILKTLVENTTSNDNLRFEHGISFYIESNNHKLLFDLGYSNLFIENALKLNVSIKDIEAVVISHGHNDHGGGLKYFLDINKNANVYLNKKAFEKHYALRPGNVMEDIGLDDSLLNNKQIILVDRIQNIFDNITIFQNVKVNYKLPISNHILYMDKDDKKVNDDFTHEQDLIIKEGNKFILFTGCSHNGIKNIIEHAKSLIGRYPDYVIGGFHLSSRTGEIETKEYVTNLANYLLETKAKYYTCHCTGINQYKILKEIMKDKIDYLSTGNEITI